MAKIQIEPHHADHLHAIGIPRELHPAALEVHDDEYESVRESWKEALPRADHETLHTKTMGTLAWRRHSAGSSVAAQSVVQSVAAEVTHHQELLRLVKAAVWLGSVALFLLLCLLAATVLAPRAHGQFSKINSVDVRNNDNSAQAFVTSPFTFKAGANCSWSVSGTTLTFNCSGGAAGAGGLNTQVQYNSTGSLAGISSLTTDGTITTALAGADWLFADLTTPTKKFQFDASNISAVTTRTMNVPDANATFAQAKTSAAHKFFTAMSAQGVFTDTQPDYGDLTGTPTLPVTIANASHKWLNSYTSGTGLFTQTQPDYSDLTGTPTLPANTTATGSSFFTAYNSSTGVFTKAQPAFTDISGSVASTQMPALTGDVTSSAGTVSTALSTTGATAASCGDTTHSCSLTVDAKGRITANSNNVIAAGSANPTNLSVQGQTAASTTVAGSTSCSGGRRYFIATITGATLTTNDLVDIYVKLHKATGTTDIPRFSICVGSAAGSGTECTTAINTGSTDGAFLMECHFTVTGASAEDFWSQSSRLTGTVFTNAVGTFSLAVASNIVIEVFGYNVNSTDTFRGDYFRAMQNVNK